jgi:hypothetical protein
MNPLGFLAGAASRAPAMRSETVLGTPYQIVTFTTASGEQVHGYFSKDNVLERTRTEVNKVPIETVFMSWQDFDGLKYPSLIIEKENGQLARVLVVSALDRKDGAPPQGKRSEP